MKDFVTKYLAHLSGYIVAGATIVSGLDPKLLPPQYTFMIALAGTVVSAAHHGYTAGTGNAILTAAANAATTALSTVPKLTPVLVACVLAVSTLSGCATAPTQTEQAGVTVAVSIATGAAISSSGNSAVQAQRAASFKAIAVEVKAVNDAGTATLTTLAADLAPLIAKLPPADQLAAHTLVAALTPFLQAETSGNVKLQNAQATVDVILQAVIDACSTYGA